MSHTNLLLGGNWDAGEWPEWVDVGHEGARDSRRYVPERTCSWVRDEDCGAWATSCGDMLTWEPYGTPWWCPSCGGKVDEV